MSDSKKGTFAAVNFGSITAEVMKKMQWLKRKLVAQIELTEWTENNHLRHTKFVGLRADKNPRSVIHEIGLWLLLRTLGISG
jgi:ATP-dependent DNA ligase